MKVYIDAEPQLTDERNNIIHPPGTLTSRGRQVLPVQIFSTLHALNSIGVIWSKLRNNQANTITDNEVVSALGTSSFTVQLLIRAKDSVFRTPDTIDRNRPAHAYYADESNIRAIINTSTVEVIKENLVKWMVWKTVINLVKIIVYLLIYDLLTLSTKSLLGSILRYRPVSEIRVFGSSDNMSN